MCRRSSPDALAKGIALDSQGGPAGRQGSFTQCRWLRQKRLRTKTGYPGPRLDSPNALGRLWATPAAWWCSQGWFLSLFSPEGFSWGPDQQPCLERWSFRVVCSAAILVWAASIAAFLSSRSALERTDRKSRSLVTRVAWWMVRYRDHPVNALFQDKRQAGGYLFWRRKAEHLRALRWIHHKWGTAPARPVQRFDWPLAGARSNGLYLVFGLGFDS